MTLKLMTGDEEEVVADAGYIDAENVRMPGWKTNTVKRSIIAHANVRPA